MSVYQCDNCGSNGSLNDNYCSSCGREFINDSKEVSKLERKAKTLLNKDKRLFTKNLQNLQEEGVLTFSEDRPASLWCDESVELSAKVEKEYKSYANYLYKCLEVAEELLIAKGYEWDGSPESKYTSDSGYEVSLTNGGNPLIEAIYAQELDD